MGKELFCSVGLHGENTDVGESMLFYKPVVVDGTFVLPWGKFIENNTRGSAENLLVIQHGLPGSQWRKTMEQKARQLVQQRKDVAALFLIPSGIGMDSEYDLGITQTDKSDCMEFAPGFFTIPFSLRQYVRQMCAAVISLEQDGFRGQIHAVGHSSGASALLYAVRKWHELGICLPASLNFLAPFVKTAVDIDDPEIALSIVNTQCAVQDAVSADSQKQSLRELFEEVRKFYKVLPCENLMTSHGELFDRRFFETIGDLSSIIEDQECDVRIIRGGKDPFIDKCHADLIADRVGKTREDIERVLAGDGHDLASLDLQDLVAES
ncbi:MAG: hypothetical protein AAB739_01535 [Patescibacteria group bacterium]